MGADGKIVAKLPNPAVSASLLAEIHGWMAEGAKMDDIIVRLRQGTVP